MTGHDLQRVERIFQAAADLPPAERAAFLETACDGDDGLRGHVERLLEHLDRDATLEPPVARAARTAGPTAAATEGPGSVIGRYKLLQVIGEGGFGVVYMAEQTEPVVRKVALKVIKLGMDTREVVARFEAERQALAMMEHPHIARVLDGGATDSGRPYFVMELVRGVPITEFCDRDDLTTRQRLTLFLDVCGAVQHAHQKGVIHRDLKPSNVLVTLHDGTPVPKVIDFGVAKAMHTKLTEKTLFTRYEQFIGTPVYMSPEQAEMSALDVDTRTDIYALGVLLYELLTGTTPFDGDSLRRAGLAEIQRIIREEQPPRPSVRISTTGDARIAGKRGLDLAALSRHLRGDLDWIVMRALEKDRGRRYPSASEMAEDIRRHLRREPVLASPPGAGYRLSRFLARNRAAVISGSLVLLALVAGIVATTIGMVAAGRNAEVAHQNAAVARRQAEHALSALDFLDSMLSLTDRQVALDPEVSVQTLLDHTSPRIADAFENHPWAEARVRATIGRAYASLALSAQAEPHLRRMIEIVDEQVAAGADPRTLGPGFSPIDYYTALWTLTNVCFNLEQGDAFAVAHFARRVGVDAIRLEDPEVADALWTFAEIVGEHAWSLEADAMAGVPAAFEEAIAAADAYLEPGDERWPIVADTFLAAGYTLWGTPHERFAADCFEAAYRIQERELPPDHPDTATTVGMLVNMLNNLGRSDEAEQLIRDTVAATRRVHRGDEYPVAVAEAMLGETLVGRGRYGEAEPILLRSHDIILATVNSASNFMATESFQRLVDLYDAWGRPEVAAPYRDVLARTCANAPTVHPWATTRRILGPEHADLLELMTRADEACTGMSYQAVPGTQVSEEVAAIFEQIVVMRRERFPLDDPRSAAVGRLLLGWANALAPESIAARRIAAEGAAEVLEAWRDVQPVNYAESLALQADVSLARGESRRARREASEAWRVLSAEPRNAQWFSAAAEARCGRTMLRLGMYEPAETLLTAARRNLETQLGPAHPDVRYIQVLLDELNDAWGRSPAQDS